MGIKINPEVIKMPEKKERNIQVRSIVLNEQCQFRVDNDGDNVKLRGYAAVFDQWTNINDWWSGNYKERIKKGAFAKTISEMDVMSVWNHNTDIVLGSSKNGTLRLSEDDYGLSIEIDPPNSPEGISKVESVKRGDVKKMSFAFEVIKKEDEYDEKGFLKNRTLTELKLYEVSPVVFPAYPQTSIGARSLLINNGIDIDIIADIVLRKKIGDKLENEDSQTVQRAIEILNGFIQEKVEPEEVHSTVEPVQYHSVESFLEKIEENKKLTGRFTNGGIKKVN